MIDYFRSSALLLTLLNPFLMIVYLVDIIQKLSSKQFRNVLIRAGIISSAVFCFFAVIGDSIFSGIMQVEFASFQIFGGIVFLLIGLQFVFNGPSAIEMLRGESEYIAGSIAMPVLIGPGTISASVIIGKRHEPFIACFTVVTAVITCLIVVLILKYLHDLAHHSHEKLIERYIEVAGRLTALYIGTVSVNMIMQGFKVWFDK